MQSQFLETGGTSPEKKKNPRIEAIIEAFGGFPEAPNLGVILHLLSAVFDLTYLSRLRRGYGTVGSESVQSVGLDVTCLA